MKTKRPAKRKARGTHRWFNGIIWNEAECEGRDCPYREMGKHLPILPRPKKKACRG